MRCAPRSAERHARYLFSEDGTTIDEQVAGLLRGRRVGLAESCSGGLLAARLTRLPGASEYVAGSVVAYSNQAKSDLLGVDPALIERHGAVSPEVAEAMADGALERFDADTAVSITGIAGPEGGTKEKPVGYVCFCAKLAGGREPRARPRDPRQPPGHPRALRAGRAPHAADPARRRGGAALVDPGPGAVRGPRRRAGPRRPPRSPGPDPLALAARGGGLGAWRRRRLPARALRALGRPLRLAGIRVAAERPRQPSLERPPPDLGAKPGRRAAGDPDPRLAGRADRVPGRDPTAGGGGTRRGGAVPAGLRVVG